MTPLLGTFSAGSVRGYRGGGDGGGLFVSATGGTVTTSGNYKIHTFTGTGTFTVTTGGTVEIILLGGGGAGGDPADRTGGGGGGAS